MPISGALALKEICVAFRQFRPDPAGELALAVFDFIVNPNVDHHLAPVGPNALLRQRGVVAGAGHD